MVSCPGKVLIAGGYLVTQEGLPGLVLSTTARFFTTAELALGPGAPPPPASLVSAVAARDWAAIAAHHPPSPAPAAPAAPSLPVAVVSPQFHTTWGYALAPGGAAALRLDPADPASRNTYVEWGVNTALMAADAHLPPGALPAAVGALAAHGYRLTLRLAADNDFYSQRAHLEAAGLPVTSGHLAGLPRFHPCPRDGASGKAVINKTGLGSSAALVTSVVGATLALAGVAALGEGAGRPAAVRLVHDVSQAAHCLAQGKVGSGFDVCSAAFGSVRYVRVPPAALEGVMDAVRAGLAAPGGGEGGDGGVPPAWAAAGRALRAVGDAVFASSPAGVASLPPALADAVRGWRLDIVSGGWAAVCVVSVGTASVCVCVGARAWAPRAACMHAPPL